jgi:hypothetical protein
MTIDDLKYLNGLVARTEAARFQYLKDKSSELYFAYHDLWNELKKDWNVELPTIGTVPLKPV